MKKFFKQLVVFSLCAAILTQVLPIYLIITGKYKVIVKGYNIYYALEKSKKKNKSRKLIIGDSVGYQLFNNTEYNEPINSLTCNQAIGMVGYYILLNNYLSAGNEIDTLFILVNPFNLNNNLDQVYTFHYFIKPFYNATYKPYFTETVNTQIKKIPYYWLYWFPYILSTNWAPDFTPPEVKDYTLLSPITIEYLKKIQELSAVNNIKIIILPTPTKNSMKKELEKFNKKEIILNGFEKEFEGYFEKMIFVDDKDFSDDVHLKKPEIYTEFYLNKYLR